MTHDNLKMEETLKLRNIQRLDDQTWCHFQGMQLVYGRRLRSIYFGTANSKFRIAMFGVNIQKNSKKKRVRTVTWLCDRAQMWAISIVCDDKRAT